MVSTATEKQLDELFNGRPTIPLYRLAAFLRLDRRTLLRWIEAGVLQSFPSGTRHSFSREMVEGFLTRGIPPVEKRGRQPRAKAKVPFVADYVQQHRKRRTRQ